MQRNVIVRCYEAGSVKESSPEEVLATVRNTLYMAGFRPVMQLTSDRHCSMRNELTGVDITLSIEDN